MDSKQQAAGLSVHEFQGMPSTPEGVLGIRDKRGKHSRHPLIRWRSAVTLSARIVVVPVQIEQPAVHRFILEEATLKPVVGVPQPLVGPVDAVAGQPLGVSRAFFEMREQIDEVRQVLLAEVEEVVRVGADEPRDEIGAVLGRIERAALGELERDVVVPAVHHDRAGDIPAILQADPQEGQVGVGVVERGEERHAGLGKRPKSSQVVVRGREFRWLAGIGISGQQIIHRIKTDMCGRRKTVVHELLDELALRVRGDEGDLCRQRARVVVDILQIDVLVPGLHHFLPLCRGHEIQEVTLPFHA